MRVLDLLVGALRGIVRALPIVGNRAPRKPPAVAAALGDSPASAYTLSSRARTQLIADLQSGKPDLVRDAVSDVARSLDQDLFAAAIADDYARICLVENHPDAFVRMAAKASPLTPLVLKEVQHCVNVGGVSPTTAWQAVFPPEKLSGYLREYASFREAMQYFHTLFPRGAAVATAAHVRSITAMITAAAECDPIFDAAVFCASAILVHHPDSAIKQQLWQAVDTGATFQRLVTSTQPEARTVLTRGIPYATADTMQRIIDLIITLPANSPAAQRLVGWIKVAVHADMAREVLRSFKDILPDETIVNTAIPAAAEPAARLTLLRTIYAAAPCHPPVQHLWDDLRQWLTAIDLVQVQSGEVKVASTPCLTRNPLQC